MCAQKVVPCILTPQGILIPDPNGAVPVTVVKNPGNPGDAPSGTISWGGKVQAFVTFHISGQSVVGYHCTDMGMSAGATQQSIENILPHMCI